MSKDIQAFNDKLVTLIKARAEYSAQLGGVSESALVDLITSADPTKAISDRVEKMRLALVGLAGIRAELAAMMADKVGRGACVALYTPKGEPAVNPLNGINSWSVRDLLAQMSAKSKSALKLSSVR